jgi:hypothetical protein
MVRMTRGSLPALISPNCRVETTRGTLLTIEYSKEPIWTVLETDPIWYWAKASRCQYFLSIHSIQHFAANTTGHVLAGVQEQREILPTLPSCSLPPKSGLRRVCDVSKRTGTRNSNSLTTLMQSAAQQPMSCRGGRVEEWLVEAGKGKGHPERMANGYRGKAG